MIELRDVSAADWFSLGQNLGIKLPKLREIEKDHPGDVRRCKTEVLDWWYRNAPVPSWESLAHALLRTGGYHGLAERLRKKGKETWSGCSTSKVLQLSCVELEFALFHCKLFHCKIIIMSSHQSLSYWPA